MKHVFKREAKGTIAVDLKKITAKEFERLFDGGLLQFDYEHQDFRINGEIVALNLQEDDSL